MSLQLHNKGSTQLASAERESCAADTTVNVTHTSMSCRRSCSRRQAPKLLQCIHHRLHAGCRDFWESLRESGISDLLSAVLQSHTSPTSLLHELWAVDCRLCKKVQSIQAESCCFMATCPYLPNFCLSLGCACCTIDGYFEVIYFKL